MFNTPYGKSGNIAQKTQQNSQGMQGGQVQGSNWLKNTANTALDVGKLFLGFKNSQKTDTTQPKPITK